MVGPETAPRACKFGADAIDKLRTRALAYDEISASFRTDRLRARLVTVDIKRAQGQGDADG